MPELISLIWDAIKILGGVVAVVSAIVAASTWFTKKWLEHGFAKELQEHKSGLEKANAIEMEKVKAGWTAELSRQSKLLDREFEALPTAWEKTHNALGATLQIASPGKSYPDALRADEARLEEILSTIDVPDSAKQEVRDERAPLDRQKAIYRLVDLVRAHEALKKIYDARNYLIGQSIFIDKETYAALMALLESARKATNEEQFNAQYPRERGERRERTECQAFLDGREALLTTAENRVRERLGTIANAEAAA